MTSSSHLHKTEGYRAAGYNIFLYLPFDNIVITTTETSGADVPVVWTSGIVSGINETFLAFITIIQIYGYIVFLARGIATGKIIVPVEYRLAGRIHKMAALSAR